MAELASLVYTEDSEQVGMALKPLGLNLDQWLDKREISLDDGIKAIDTQAFVASSQDLVVVAFRGTEVEADNPADILTDAQVSKQELDWFDEIYRDRRRPRAHHGFAEALDAVWNDLWSALMALGTANPGRPVWFVGHSLGGALAVLAAVRYAIERDAENRDRYSMPFFLHPKPDAVLSVLPKFREGTFPPDITANDFLTERLRAIGLT